MRFRLVLFIFFIAFHCSAQSIVDESITKERYLEDQMYFGLSYNILVDLPEGSNQRNLSYGLMGGFLKDLPLNKAGTHSLALGAGLAINNYYSNIVARESVGGFTYGVENEIKRTKLETHLLEFPLEFRWRTSTLDDYKFWRVYAGVKAAYVLSARSKYLTEDTKNGFFNTDVANWQYGVSLSVGWNTYNIHAYYGLTDIFGGNAVINDKVLKYVPLRIGLVFYIL